MFTKAELLALANTVDYVKKNAYDERDFNERLGVLNLENNDVMEGVDIHEILNTLFAKIENLLAE